MRFFRRALRQCDCCPGKKRAWGHRGDHVRKVVTEGLPAARRQGGKVLPGGRQEPTLRTPGSWLSCPRRAQSCFCCLSPECVVPCRRGVQYAVWPPYTEPGPVLCSHLSTSKSPSCPGNRPWESRPLAPSLAAWPRRAQHLELPHLSPPSPVTRGPQHRGPSPASLYPPMSGLLKGVSVHEEPLTVSLLRGMEVRHELCHRLGDVPL